MPHQPYDSSSITIDESLANLLLRPLTKGCRASQPIPRYATPGLTGSKQRVSCRQEREKVEEDGQALIEAP